MHWTPTDRLAPPAVTPMQQHPAYGAACAATGTAVQGWSLGPPRAPRATALVLLRRWPGFGRWAMIGRGPVWSEDTGQEEAAVALEALIRQLRRDCRGVMVTADCLAGADPLRGRGLLQVMSPGSMARLDLSGTSAQRRARQHGKWRNRLVHAEASGIAVHRGPLTETGHWLLDAEEGQARRRRYRRLPKSFALAWVAANGPGSAQVFTARHRGRIVAGMLFLRHGRAASYHTGWSDTDGRAVDAHRLLLWQAGEWLARQGCAWCDLGTLDTVDTPGLARFKLGSGAAPVRLGGTWMSAPLSRPFAWLQPESRRPAQRLAAPVPKQAG